MTIISGRVSRSFIVAQPCCSGTVLVRGGMTPPLASFSTSVPYYIYQFILGLEDHTD
jgi:hypothetical protein